MRESNSMTGTKTRNTSTMQDQASSQIESNTESSQNYMRDMHGYQMENNFMDQNASFKMARKKGEIASRIRPKS